MVNQHNTYSCTLLLSTSRRRPSTRQSLSQCADRGRLREQHRPRRPCGLRQTTGCGGRMAHNLRRPYGLHGPMGSCAPIAGGDPRGEIAGGSPNPRFSAIPDGRSVLSVPACEDRCASAGGERRCKRAGAQGWAGRTRVQRLSANASVEKGFVSANSLALGSLHEAPAHIFLELQYPGVVGIARRRGRRLHENIFSEPPSRLRPGGSTTRCAKSRKH